jgi:capsular polysaccharide biosynthesis protein
MQEQENDIDKEQSINLMEYLEIAWRKKWLILLPTIGCAILAGIYSFSLPKKWEITALIQPGKFTNQTATGQLEEVVVIDPKQLAGQINQDAYNNLIAAELNLDINNVPALQAENLKDTKLVKVSIRDKDVQKSRAVISSLFSLVKSELDKRIDVETKTIDAQIVITENMIKQKNVDIHSIELGKQNLDFDIRSLEVAKQNLDLDINSIELGKQNLDLDINSLEVEKENLNLGIKSFEVEKENLGKEISSIQNRLSISAQRLKNLLEEMSSAKKRINGLEDQQKNTLAGKKAGNDALSLLLYSNEIQQNLRYYNTLEDNHTNETINQESLKMFIETKGSAIKNVDLNIETKRNAIKNVNLNIETKRNAIKNVMLEIDAKKISLKQIDTQIDKTKNEIDGLKSQITFSTQKKGRIDYTALMKEPTSSLSPVAPNKRRIVMIAGFLAVMVFTFLAFLLEYLKRYKSQTEKSNIKNRP